MTSVCNDRRMYTLLAANIASSVGTGISGIAVPWYLIQRPGGEAAFGYLMFGMTIMSFLLAPSIGVWVDRFSRKRLLLINQCIGLAVTLPLALWGMIAGHYSTWQLVTVSAAAFLYYNLHFPTQFALVQEIFDRSRYRTLNGLLEVQSQAAAMISGGLASLLLGMVDFHWILTVDAVTYLLGFLLLWTLPYRRERVERGTSPVSRSWWGDLSKGARYLRNQPRLTLFFLCTMLPFIGVMASNYLNPIYVVDTLKADAAVMGLQEMLYAVGAVSAGITIPWLMRRLGAYVTLLVTVGFYTLATSVLAWVPVVTVFLTIKFLFGWGNAGTRVARNTLMMELVPNRLIGRVNSFFMGVGYMLRITLLGLFTQTVPQWGAMWAYRVLFIVMMLGWLGVILSRGVVKGDANHEEQSPLKTTSASISRTRAATEVKQGTWLGSNPMKN
ncbi:Na+/melibiose symporter-like transporter [Melghirimyces profundicolus]|uniref:Na+/melibiose symporter-like transporter n=1 Tax=Melghirimyces profundicolus TaxID=1242148 RepID=A0A2T6BS50_9BACL|nr:MFS transporter [Melghirimyces profundicolus]PTX58901.1 Na+/melibiose symporter-like transporter [Melghirimyces profundicolus]